MPGTKPSELAKPTQTAEVGTEKWSQSSLSPIETEIYEQLPLDDRVPGDVEIRRYMDDITPTETKSQKEQAGVTALCKAIVEQRQKPRVGHVSSRQRLVADLTGDRQ